MNIKLEFGLIPLLLMTQLAQADSQWFSYTLDNDIFVGNDSGYSNGMYFSWINIDEDEKTTEPSVLLQALLWSVEGDGNLTVVASNTIGQAINTPQDIKEANPDEADLPYSGLLFLIVRSFL